MYNIGTMDSFTTNVNEAAAHIEFFFNVADSVPVVGFVTSAARITAAKVQVVAAIIICVIGVGGELISDLRDDRLSAKKFEKVTAFGCEHFAHGMLNIVRGYIEVASQICTLGFATLFFQFCLTPKFGPFFEYNHVDYQELYA